MPGMCRLLSSGPENRNTRTPSVTLLDTLIRFAAVIDFDITLAQQMYAGADLFLMLFVFEPCRLVANDFLALTHRHFADCA